MYEYGRWLMVAVLLSLAESGTFPRAVLDACAKQEQRDIRDEMRSRTKSESQCDRDCAGQEAVAGDGYVGLVGCIDDLSCTV